MSVDFYDPNDFLVHVDELAKYEDAKVVLKETLKHIYITGNIDDFEDAIDELCNIFGIKIPYAKPLIRGK